jgi:hypothetical protein
LNVRTRIALVVAIGLSLFVNRSSSAMRPNAHQIERGSAINPDNTVMNSNHLSLEFLRRVSRPRRSAKSKIASISEYIEWQSAMLTSEHLEKLRAELPTLDLRLRAMAPVQFPYLAR